jgi:hypothetical protein
MVSQSVSLGVELHLGLMTRYLLLFDSYGLVLWGALSDERTGLSFAYAGGPRQRSHSWVRAPWDSWPYFTVSGLRLPFSSPPTTRRVTVEVFEPASTWVIVWNITRVALYSLRVDRTENPIPLLVSIDRRGNVSHGSYCCVRNITPKTSHVALTDWVHWRADLRLAASYKRS